jgi:hypothetical protein
MEISKINITTINPISLPGAQPVTPTIHKQWRIKGKYVKCGSKEHWISKCPLAPYSGDSVSTSGKKVTVADIFHDPDGDYDSNDDDDGYNSSDYRFIRGGTP